MARFKDVDWSVTPADTNPRAARNCEEARLAVLMDIRDEMKRMNNVLHCQNTIDIPNILRRIEKNTAKPKRRKKAVK